MLKLSSTFWGEKISIVHFEFEKIFFLNYNYFNCIVDIIKSLKNIHQASLTFNSTILQDSCFYNVCIPIGESIVLVHTNFYKLKAFLRFESFIQILNTINFFPILL